jgi:hypothetical protein
MHPEDVAEFVAESVGVLAEKLQQNPELGGPPHLEGTKLYIPFLKMERTLIRHAVDTGLVGPGGGGVSVVHQVPLLGQPPTTRELILHLDLADYDGQPPTAELLLPDRSQLPAPEWPKSIHGQGIVASHKDYGRPFFCRRGLREYHSHPQHEDDPWDKYREHLALHQIVIELLDGLRNTWIGR